MRDLRNAWYVASWAQEVACNRLKGMRILNEPIVLWRNAAGELAAFEDRCVHRLAPLSLGRCEGERLRCMYHGLLYDRAGRVVEIPGQDQVSSRLKVRSYPVVERHGWVWVWMGEESAADVSLIPPVLGMDRPGYVFGHGQLDYAAEARLINDNLLDFSHIPFLHINSVPVSDIWARQRPQVTEHERHVRIERWIRDCGVSGLQNAEERLDSYHRCDFFVPGLLLITGGAYPVGTADTLNGAFPAIDPQEVNSFATHAVTPMTDRTTRYFYLFGRRPVAQETVLDIRAEEMAFAEDKAMIEAQQRTIDLTPNHRFIATSADKGIVFFNRLVERLIGS